MNAGTTRQVVTLNKLLVLLAPRSRQRGSVGSALHRKHLSGRPATLRADEGSILELLERHGSLAYKQIAALLGQPPKRFGTL